MSSAVLALLPVTAAAEKPLKVFILAGQSNMQGKARVRTIERLKMTEDGKSMSEAMIGEDGTPRAAPGVHGVYFTSGRQGPSVTMGPLSPSYGEPSDPNHSFGPEYTFGIYMQQHLKEPFLVIKTAWGGKNLLQQFRPPSAGEAPFSAAKAEKLKAEGKLEAAEKKALAANPELAHKPRARANAVKRIINEVAVEVLTADEQKLREVGRSNAAYHYNGSAYTMGKIGKAFADAMAKMAK